ncbi:MAG: hypothetical protein ACLQKA_18345 [Bryobacteraceae bacterium]
MKDVLTLEAGNAALEEIEVRKAQLSAALAETGVRLAEAETGLGDAVLDGNESAAREVADLRLRVDGLNAGLAALEVRRAQALLAQRRASAEDLRRQAVQRHAELEALERKTAKHLAALSELEGVTFTRCILAAQRAPNGWERQVTAGTAHIDFCDPSEALRWLSPGNPYLRTRSRQLYDQAIELERKATEIENQLDPPVAPPEDHSEFLELYGPKAAPPEEFGRAAGSFSKAPPLWMR